MALLLPLTLPGLSETPDHDHYHFDGVVQIDIMYSSRDFPLSTFPVHGTLQGAHIILCHLCVHWYMRIPDTSLLCFLSKAS
jgi:hypothetical protein